MFEGKYVDKVYKKTSLLSTVPMIVLELDILYGAIDMLDNVSIL